MKLQKLQKLQKLLVVSPAYWPAANLGGPVVSLHALNKALVKKGIDVTVYTTDVRLEGRVRPGLETHLDGVRVTYFSYCRLFEFIAPTGWQFSLPMRRALKKNIGSFDLAYILSVWNHPVAMAASVCRAAGKPYVISPRGLLYPETFGNKRWKKKLYYDWVVRRSVEAADAIHYTSDDEAEKCHGRLGLKNPVVVAPNGVDLPDFDTLPDRGRFRSKHPVLRDKTVILFLGRISWKKGVDLLIGAFDRLCRERGDLHLVIAGGDEEGQRNKLLRQIDRCGLRDKVLFTGGLNGEDKLEAYRAADVFVLPSHSENFGMTVVESMACGLPVVISNRVGIHRQILDRNAGVVVETDVPSVAGGIRRLLDDAQLRKTLSANGRRTARELFSTDIAAAQMIGTFERIVSRHATLGKDSRAAGACA